MGDIRQDIKRINREVEKLKCCISTTSPGSDVTYDTFQIVDCNGDNVGTPQDVQKTVVLNSLQVAICNIDALAEAIAAQIVANTPTAALYNTTNTLILPQGTTYNIPANTIHAYTLEVKNGSTGINSTITFNGGTPIPLTEGDIDAEEYSTLNANSIDIYCDYNDIIKLKIQQ